MCNVAAMMVAIVLVMIEVIHGDCMVIMVLIVMAVIMMVGAWSIMMVCG